jgi:hypothetical protein
VTALALAPGTRTSYQPAAAAGADRAIRVSTAVAVLARLEPATIDGLVYASSTVNLYAARHRLPVPGQARAKAGSTWTSPAPSFGLPEEVHPVAGSRTCLLRPAWRLSVMMVRSCWVPRSERTSLGSRGSCL